MTHMGQNSSGDFDQLSLHGVDFGEDYMKTFNGEITTMEGVDMYAQQMGYDADQLGYYENQMGLIPSGMGRNPDFGLIPSGMGHPYSNQMGGIMDTLKKPAFTLGTFPVTYLHVGILALLGLGYYAHKEGLIRIPGL